MPFVGLQITFFSYSKKNIFQISNGYSRVIISLSMRYRVAWVLFHDRAVEYHKQNNHINFPSANFQTKQQFHWNMSPRSDLQQISTGWGGALAVKRRQASNWAVALSICICKFLCIKPIMLTNQSLFRYDQQNWVFSLTQFVRVQMYSITYRKQSSAVDNKHGRLSSSVNVASNWIKIPTILW